MISVLKMAQRHRTHSQMVYKSQTYLHVLFPNNNHFCRLKVHTGKTSESVYKFYFSHLGKTLHLVKTWLQGGSLLADLQD